ncbi:dihydroxyacetone kinase transcriptional activator DhaS [Helicovermis profundi]|uniref:TetR/AcrR family transcriptional regulator n=1 Tax=Helicovermis profundi TaxID=3065157 RepID=A0AAU9EF58_9FIRM|nr:TetR/AcrR family transcriptional regulator [Clostridia bacterium S502]
MSESLITKKALADSIKQLMKTHPLAKISIQKIVSNCNLSRKTFYYHFQDKFDLVNWIFITEISKKIANCNHYENWTEGTYRTLEYLMRNKYFYVNAFNTPGQNSFDECFYNFCFDILMCAISELSINMIIPSIDKKFIADFYTHAFVGITIQWVKNGMKDSPSDLVEGINNVIEGSMPHALNKYKTQD